jgi:hypothetical protein
MLVDIAELPRSTHDQHHADELALLQHAAAALRDPMKYAERWSAFVRAVEIADEVLRTATTYSAEDKQLLLSCNLGARTEPLQAYRNLASLRYTEQDFFDTWNEDAGPDVERFWARVGAEGLPFERNDVLVKILARGSVRGGVEFDWLIDNLDDARDAGRVTNDDLRRVQRMMVDFETKPSAKKKKAGVKKKPAAKMTAAKKKAPVKKPAAKR